jgi:hypothetical protein
MIVGMRVGLLVSALVGLLVSSLVGTLVTGGCGCMERVILLLYSQWFVVTLGGACTLGFYCVLLVAAGVVVSTNLLGCACK